MKDYHINIFYSEEDDHRGCQADHFNGESANPQVSSFPIRPCARGGHRVRVFVSIPNGLPRPVHLTLSQSRTLIAVL